MSRLGSERGRALSLAAVLIILAGLYLGVRAWATVREVLSPDFGTTAAREAAPADDVKQAQAQDARLAAVSDPERDPFHAPRRTVYRPPVRAAEPAAEAPPVIRMILFDEVSPEVQIEVEGQLSGRLKIGSAFRGWAIASISENTVVVSKDGETHTLRLRR
jgi:hypothetical protein